MTTPTPADLSLIEYRLHAVAIGHFALKQVVAWDETPSIEIFFDGLQVIEGKATAFTNGAIEAAIVHSRALLEFLGLGGMGPTKLRELTGTRRTDDTGVEKFSKLTMLSISDAVRSDSGSPAEAEEALAYVIYLANKGLAHTTSSFTKHDQGSVLLEIAFLAVPTLVINRFYVPLQIEPPKYELPGRKRLA